MDRKLTTTLRWTGWTLFVGTIITYGLYQSRGILSGPLITITTPQNGETVFEPLIQVSGSAPRVKDLTLNGRSIFINMEGNFDERLLLLPGYNIIELTARDVGGKEARRTIELVYQPSPTPTPTASTTTNVEEERVATTSAEFTQ